MAESEQRELEVVEAARGGYELGQVGGAALAQRVAAQVEQGARVEVGEFVVVGRQRVEGRNGIIGAIIIGIDAIIVTSRRHRQRVTLGASST